MVGCLVHSLATPPALVSQGEGGVRADKARRPSAHLSPRLPRVMQSLLQTSCDYCTSMPIMGYALSKM